MPQAQGPFTDLALHTIGWKAFQDMAAQVCEELLKTQVTVHHEAKDGGQDAVFLIPATGEDVPPTGTVQVKYSSDAKGTLKLSDLSPEIEKLKKLVATGEADTYIFITNMSANATNAKALRDRLRELGVKRPHVWSKEQVTLTIKSSPRLRALVPQVYGLGDLSSILDLRAIEQTKAILKGWLPKLKAYVPTNAHNRAVRILDKHGIVLLLGNPASGKSTIGAILSTMAVEDEDHSVIQISTPQEFVQHWNPDDKNRFFWIDDAFGSNVVDPGSVQQWAKEFSKVTAAIKGGNRFLFTSRGYIYNAAHGKLGSRNLALFRTRDAVVNVGQLTKLEKGQILYNHIKHGDQEDDWKSRAKRHLASILEVPNFLPGISERLGNPDFTKKLALTEKSLCAFMAEPEEHLIDILNELEKEQFAALALIYVHRGQLNSGTPDPDATKAIEESTGCSFSAIVERLPELAGSFTRIHSEGFGQEWGFEHPTIADAITTILDEKPNMTGAIIRGAPIEKVMKEFVCDGVPDSQNAARIPKSMNGVLNLRLKDAPDSYSSNGDLFDFLALRASDDVLIEQFGSHPHLIDRRTYSYSRASYDSRYTMAARAHRLGVLEPYDRSAISEELFQRAVSNFDLSCLSNADLLSMMEPKTLVALGISMTLKVTQEFEDVLSEKRDDINLDDDIDDQYENISTGLYVLEEFMEDYDTSGNGNIWSSAKERLAEEIAEVLEEQETHRAEQEKEGDWEVFATSKPENSDDEKPEEVPKTRSIFDDIDEG